ncbi:hypothetical protein [Massilia orientalis]|uniref:Uncharacterized protein n=1 Tax=Massilia orientalis TaxID=3050128 RepID=A0ACC7MFA5_9BURK|nr:hypothetical protein [Massilia sp. YIM B02787]
MSRGFRLGEDDLQQLVARTRGVSASVGAQASVAPAVAAPGPAPASAPRKSAGGGRSSRVPVPMKVSEDELQISCFEWIELMRPAHPILEWVIHVPNGGKRPRGAAGKLKAMGVKPGVLDVLLPLPYNGWSGLAIEMKVGKNTTTEQQDDWLQVMGASGYYTAVCYNLEEFMAHVNRFLVAPSPLTPEYISRHQSAYLASRRSRPTAGR